MIIDTKILKRMGFEKSYEKSPGHDVWRFEDYFFVDVKDGKCIYYSEMFFKKFVAAIKQDVRDNAYIQWGD